MRTVAACDVEFVRVAMTEPHRPRVKYVIGPDGSPLTIADLPAPGTKRWVIRRKAEVVAVLDRPAWPGRPAHDAHSAIPAVSAPSSARPNHHYGALRRIDDSHRIF